MVHYTDYLLYEKNYLEYKPRTEEALKEAVACPSGFTLCNNRCFKYIFEVVKTQAGSQEFCQLAFGGWLPSAIDSAGLECLKQIGKSAFTGTHTVVSIYLKCCYLYF